MAMDQDQLFQVLKGFKADLESSLTTQLANVMADARAQTQGLENQLAATQRVVEERMNVMEANVRTMASQAAAQAVAQAGQVASAVAIEQVSAVLNRATTSTPAGGTTTTAGPGTVSGAGAGAGLARNLPLSCTPSPTLPCCPMHLSMMEHVLVRKTSQLRVCCHSWRCTELLLIILCLTVLSSCKLQVVSREMVVLSTGGQTGCRDLTRVPSCPGMPFGWSFWKL